MSKYKIKVNVELIECDESEPNNVPTKQKDGGFAMTINESDAIRNGDEITSPSRCIDLGQICSISNHKS
ncbi:MAG: hypothetical protein JRE64_28605 [Deltaproteobacteria bacterium]|nr:hypothetical protein [Deltaproteobacteria bacterium]